MISSIVKFISGFFIGTLLVFAITYSVGLLLENIGIVLYDSESDQQRNFNFFVLIWLILSITSGYLATKLWKKTN